MSFIRTVLGDIAPELLGVCYAHEHIIIDPSFATQNEPDFLLDDVEKAVVELKELKALGVGAVVDSMPCDCGRNVEKLAEVSRQSGVHIVAPTGIHLPKYYPPDHWGQSFDLQKFSRLFRDEIENGVDAVDENGSRILLYEHRAGVIKVAAGATISEMNQSLFGAAARMQKQTGCPILTHTEEGKSALEQALFLQGQGADLNHVVLSHLDRNLDANYHREVLRTGVTIEYDSHFRWKNKSPNPTLKLLKELLSEFPDQIILGMDAARRSYWKSYGGGPGLSYLYDDFKNRMSDAGINEKLVDKVFVSTPARVYSFISPVEAQASNLLPNVPWYPTLRRR